MPRKFSYIVPSIAKLLLSYVKQQVPCGPGFPVKFVGVDKLHAAFLNESRTRGRLLGPRTGNLGISLVLREMWDSTGVDLEFLRALKS